MSGVASLLALAACVAGVGEPDLGVAVETGDTSPAAVPLDCDPATVERWQEWPEELLPQRADPSGTQPGGSIGDLDGDGDLDVLLAYGGGDAVFVNDGTGTLTMDDTWRLGGEPLPGAVSSALADLDADGDLDAWFGVAGGKADHIGWNEGGGSFRDEELPDSDGTPGTGSFADFDGDRDLDLFVSGFVDSLDMAAVQAGTQVGTGTRLYMQEDGVFVDRKAWLPAEVDVSISFQGSVLDADLDGDLDVYLASDYGENLPPNRLLLNDGTGHFTVSTDCLCDKAMASMGNGVGDANGDGLADVYISDFGPPSLMLGDGQGAFTEAAAAMGADVPGTPDHQSGWGTAFADLDRNGCMDLVITYGESCHSCEYFDDSEVQYDQLLYSDCEGGFTRAEPYTPGFDDPGRTRSVIVGDLDADGRADLVTIGKHFLRTWHLGGGCETGLTVQLAGAGLNVHAIGARVAVEAAGRVETQWVLPATASSSSAFDLYFGLAGADAAARVEVTWPDGQVQEFSDVPAGLRALRE